MVDSGLTQEHQNQHGVTQYQLEQTLELTTTLVQVTELLLYWTILIRNSI